MDENEKKIGTKLDKLVMGIILGGAVGSVLGLTLAPRKGTETRNILKKKGHELLEKGKDVSKKLVSEHKETFASAKYQIKKGKNLFKWLFGGKKSTSKMPKATMDIPEDRE